MTLIHTFLCYVNLISLKLGGKWDFFIVSLHFDYFTKKLDSSAEILKYLGIVKGDDDLVMISQIWLLPYSFHSI